MPFAGEGGPKASDILVLEDLKTDFTGDNRWQKSLESYRIHMDFCGRK